MALLRRYPQENQDQSPIIYEITAEIIQQWIEGTFEKRLSEIELERMYYSMTEDPMYLADLILKNAENAMDNSNGQWDSVDEHFRGRKALYKIGDYEIGEDKSSIFPLYL